VRQDEPLAYGLERLRDARAVLASRQGRYAEQDLEALDAALGRDRVARVQAISRGADVAAHLASELGPLPESGAARDTWCGLAYRIEARLDRGLPVAVRTHLGGVSVADRLARHGSIDPLDHPRSIITAASAVPDIREHDAVGGPDRWLDAVEKAVETRQAIDRQRSRELDHDLGISL